MNKNTIKDYYQTEMQLLNEGAIDFAMRHPHEAGRLNIDSVYDRDPHIARLLEGSAYLNARVKQQIDLGVGHISEALVRQLAPQYLTPYPSMTVVQFSSLEQRITDLQHIPAGAKLRSAQVGEEKTECEFTTTQAIDILPMQLLDAHCEQLAGDRSALTLFFQLNEGAKRSWTSGLNIPIFINSTPNSSSIWHDFLVNKLCDIKIKFSGQEESSLKTQARIEPMNFHYHDTMLPQLSRHIKAFELLSDYFLFQEKYWFVQLLLSNIEFNSISFELKLEFSEPLPDLRLPKDLFKLHCVPAANIFKTSAEPIRYQDSQSQYPLTVAHGQNQSKRLLAIQQVSAFKRQALTSMVLHDFYQQEHDAVERCHYRLSAVMMKEDESRYALTFSGKAMEDMHISCDILAFNGHYPRQFLHPYSLKLADERVPALVLATNLTRPTRFYRPDFSREFANRVLAQINARFDCLMNLEHFKQMLALHDWSGSHNAQIQAIESIELKPYNRLQKGVVVRGLSVELKIADKGFSSLSEIKLFTRVLHHFLRYFAPLNTQVQTLVETFPSVKLFKWFDNA